VDVTYTRAGKKNTVSITPDLVHTYQLGCTFNSLPEPAKLIEVAADFPLGQSGVQVGDVIVDINGTKIASGSKLSTYLGENPLTEKATTLTYLRDGKETTITVNPKFVSSGYEMGWIFNMAGEKVSALNVVKYSVYELKYNIVNTIKSLGYLITGKVKMNEMMGPVGIVNVVGEVVSEAKSSGIGVTLLSLAEFCILLSANLGVMNLLPLPALDGGRLVFILIEAIRGKPVPREKEAVVHLVGMALLMILMVFVIFNDIRNIFG
jgi:regulator of sigma E protease